MNITHWHGCYDFSWKGFITPESFDHPAKFARGLIERIFDHCLAKGYLKPGDTVGDCFGGIGSGGVIAAYRGLQWYGCELEPRFVALAEENFEMHRSRFKALSAPGPRIIQGDSRAFHVLLGGDNAAVVCSPPYADIAAGAGGLNTKPAKHPGQQSGRTVGLSSQNTDQKYGCSDGQISRLKSGTVDGVVCSPPFTQGYAGGGGINKNGYQNRPDIAPDYLGSRTYQGTAGERTEGNIETLTPGTVSAVVSSPPWESNSEGSRKASKMGGPEKVLKCNRGHGASDAAVLAQAVRDEQKIYGDSPGQIGKEKGETYWEAVSAVYQSCYQSLKPGGIIVLVVKDYVKDRKIVPLCEDTCRLLAHVGFTPLERIHAMLVKESSHGDLFTGHTTETKSRKSFFRRLAEKNGSPAIDFEQVLIFQKP